MILDAALRKAIHAQLASFEVISLEPGSHRRAAVGIVLVEAGTGAQVPGIPDRPGWSREAAVLLTRRPQTMRRHAGQWALPGGRIDAGETPEQAALRELHEEVGIDVAMTEVLGRLDDVATKSGFVMTPVVLWGGKAPVLSPDPEEVESVHRIPVSELMRTDAPWLEKSDVSGGTVLRMPLGDTWVAAPTGAILYQFRELCIGGRATRVAHFEHPEFAWK